MDSIFNPSRAIIEKFEIDPNIQKQLNEMCTKISNEYEHVIEGRLKRRLKEILNRDVTKADVEEHGGIILERLDNEVWRRYRWDGKLILSVSSMQWGNLFVNQAEGEYRMMAHPRWVIIDEYE